MADLQKERRPLYKSSRLFTIVVIIIITFSNCLYGSGREPIPKADDSGVTQEGVSSVVNANNQFAFDLYSEFKDNGENIFFSPYSISVALALTYEGARGQTAEEMRSVLHFPEDANIRRPAFAWIYNQINKKDRAYQLHTANALWVQKDYQFLDDYISLIERYYAGKATNLDFIKETEKSRKNINSWVEDHTNNKIKDLIPQDYLNPLTRFVITNAIYFKGDWLKKFDKKNTREEDFRISPSKTVKVPMMSLTGEIFNYTETENLQILELPYVGEDLSMLVILPKDNLGSVEKSLSLEKLDEWRNMLREQRVDVYIPTFTFQTKFYISETLKKMGMPTAFSRNANFSGMDGTRNLFIDFVIHQAFVKVNEEGTEAAAATGVGGATSVPPPPPIFRADHPFIFLIQEEETGNILFLGRVVDPTK